MTVLRCAGAVILDGRGRIFLQRRSSTRTLFPDTWDIVGGHVEPGESVLDALRREITEETGWRLAEILASLDPISYTGDDGHERVEEDFVVRVDGDPDDPRLEADKHTEYRWVTERELADLYAAEAPTVANEQMYALLKAAFAAIGGGGRPEFTA